MTLNYAIRRTGEFPVYFTGSNQNQCGDVGTPILKFDVEIVAGENGLDDGGWVLDNNAIPTYFSRKYSHIDDFPSCEEIARRAVQDFIALCGPSKDGKKCRAKMIRVTVSGIANSGITALWKDYSSEPTSIGVVL